MDKLKPCPFCGAKAEISKLPEVPDEIRSGMWVVGCDGSKEVCVPAINTN